MQQRYFITSTGTGIGKTFITAALTRQARALGKSVVAYKPLISGFDPTQVAESDTGILLKANGLEPTRENIARVSPWCFAQPLAPSMAARFEKRQLNFEEIVEHGRKVMAGPEDLVLIEGVGGVMVPVTEKRTVRDWIEALEIEAVLVAGSYPGTISHTLTALECMQHRKIPIFAVIVNESENSSVSLQDTVNELSRWTRLPLIAVKRYSNGEELRTLPS